MTFGSNYCRRDINELELLVSAVSIGAIETNSNCQTAVSIQYQAKKQKRTDKNFVIDVHKMGN